MCLHPHDGLGHQQQQHQPWTTTDTLEDTPEIFHISVTILWHATGYPG